MKKKIDLNLLTQICGTAGISGFENRIRNLIKNYVAKYFDKVYTDNIGNLICYKKGKNSTKKLMTCSHMDEIGLIVNHIDKDGFIRFNPVGGFDPKTLSSQRVTIHGKEDILGVLGSKPIHTMTEEEKKIPVKIEDFFIDTGMPKTQIEKYISIGNPITRKIELSELGDCITSKAIDNRISVYTQIEALKLINKLEYDLYMVFSVQEEVGLRGAIVAAQNIKPDFAINLDTGIAADTPDNISTDKSMYFGSGPGIKIMDRTIICDTRMVEYMKSIAIKNKIKYQLEVKKAGGTDTSSLQLYGKCIAGAISIPTRYLHQATESVNKEDVLNSINLLSLCINNIDKFTWD